MTGDIVVTNFKSPKTAKKAKKTRRNYSKQCDELAGRLVRSRGRCEHCGTTQDLQWAHGFSRRYRNIRWNLDATFCLCRGCHMYFTYRPIEWDDWLRAKWGDEQYTALRSLALSDNKAHKPDLKTLAAELREQWAKVSARFGGVA